MSALGLVLLLWCQYSFFFLLHACPLSWFSHVWLCATLGTVACQASPSLWFSRQEYWSGLPCPCPGDLPNPRIEPASLLSPALAGGSSATCEVPFFSYGCFKIFFLTSNFQQFYYDVPNFTFLWTYLAWNSYFFLNPWLDIFHQWEILSYSF